MHSYGWQGTHTDMHYHTHNDMSTSQTCLITNSTLPRWVDKLFWTLPAWSKYVDTLYDFEQLLYVCMFIIFRHVRIGAHEQLYRYVQIYLSTDSALVC